MTNVLIVFGTRPEAIKMAPLVKEFKKYPELFKTKVCVTAQHREMLDQVLAFFGIVPDFDLDLMQPSQTLNRLSANILLKIDCEGEEYAIFDLLKESKYLNNVVVGIIEWHEKGATSIEKVLINNQFKLRLENHVSENSGMIYAFKA